MNYQTLPISASFPLEVIISREEVKLSDVDKKLVDALWLKAQKQDTCFFNGKFLNFVSYNSSKNRLKGEFLDYKYYVAQLLDSGLKKRLKIQPIAISCLCLQKEFLLVGKRSSFVTDYPGYYELVPSGGVEPQYLEGNNRMNVCRQALAELEEETGIRSEQVKTCDVKMCIFDKQSNLYEIILQLEVNNADLSSQSNEYSELIWMPKKEAAEYAKRSKWVPLSLFLLDQL